MKYRTNEQVQADDDKAMIAACSAVLAYTIARNKELTRHRRIWCVPCHASYDWVIDTPKACPICFTWW